MNVTTERGRLGVSQDGHEVRSRGTLRRQNSCKNFGVGRETAVTVERARRKDPSKGPVDVWNRVESYTSAKIRHGRRGFSKVWMLVNAAELT